MKTNTSDVRIAERRQLLLSKRDSLIAQFSRAARRGKQRRLTGLSSKVEQTNEFLAALDQIEAGLESKGNPSVTHQVQLESGVKNLARTAGFAFPSWE